MPPSSKADKKAAVDAAAWMFNIVTSVGIIIVNKALMAKYGFTFATTLTGLHFVTTTLMTVVLRWLGYIQPSHLPTPELLKFVLFANFSIVGMNVSLMWNSVGFYQIAKLSMIPVSCLFEVMFDKIQYSRDTKLSISVVLLGVAVCTVTDVSLNGKGFIAAFIAVWTTALQQYYVHYLQRKYSLSSFNLLGHTAPIQAGSLLVVGPFLDYWLTDKRVDSFKYDLASVVFILLSCTIAVGTNLSQFICIGRFTAVSFQVLGLPTSLHTSVMVASQMSLLILSLLAVISLTPVISAYPATIYEALVQFGLPAGVLPDSVTSYTYNPTDSSFVVELKKPCYIKFDYLVYFDKKITGKINLGVLSEIKGLQAQVYLFWLNIDSIRVDVPATSNVYLTLGSISQTLDIKQFQTIHPCRDNALAACDHASKNLISQLPITAE